MIHILFLPQPKFRLPHDAFLYGIAYDASGFIVYNFFPRAVETDEYDMPTIWGYGCAAANTRYATIFQDHRREKRLNAIQALLAIQRHGRELVNKFREAQFPGKLLQLHKLWDNAGLWGN